MIALTRTMRSESGTLSSLEFHSSTSMTPIGIIPLGHVFIIVRPLQVRIYLRKQYVLFFYLSGVLQEMGNDWSI